MPSNPSPTITKRLCHIVRLLYYMLRNSISKRKLMMDLQLLLKRGKLAGKAFTNFIALHHHNGAASPAATGRSFEFSCSNTPVFAAAKKKNRRRGHVEFDSFEANMMAKAFQLWNAEVSDMESAISSAMPTPSPSPSPGAMWWFGRSPAAVRQLRVTDSPFMVKEEEEVVEEGKVDREAEDFIRWFYEQLRWQRLESGEGTPENTKGRSPLPTIVGRVLSRGEGRRS